MAYSKAKMKSSGQICYENNIENGTPRKWEDNIKPDLKL
jgi:hypothetical protein